MSDKTSTRRGFFLKAGAAISAPAAFTVSVPATADTSSKLELRIADLEDANALRRLSAEFISRINAGVDTGVVFRSAVAEIAAEDFDNHAIVDISDDRRQASLRITCTVGFDVPIEAPGSVLVEMAQLQGEGSLRQMRAQILELSCARAQSGWTITRAQFVNAV